ncbi:S9 family peptidase [Virgibacillus sp. MG-45]|uniref:S9 family peptidase n=1 Tax=Virgibacillus sp. MG-45 TaxID=3102791 RepID=UPI002EDB9FEF
MIESKRAIQAEDLTKIEVYSDPQFLPSGNGFLYVSTTINDEQEYEAQIYSQALKKTVKKQWTFTSNKNIHPRISPDGTKIVYQSNKSGIPQLWLLSTDGGEAQQITTFKNGAVNPEWSKDGRYIIFTASLDKDDDVQQQKEQSEEERKQEKEETSKKPLLIKRLRYKSDAQGFHDEKRSQIVLYDIDTKAFIQLTTADADHTYQDISPDGKHILFTANLNSEADYELTNDLYIVNVESKKVNKLTDGNGSYFQARFSPSGTKIACFGHEQAYAGATQSELYIFDRQSGNRLTLSEHWDMQLGDLMIGDTRLGDSETGPIWSTDEKQLYFIATYYGATGLYQTNLQGEINVLYNENNHVFGFSYHEESEGFILGVSTPTDPCNFYYLSKEKQLKQITDANKLLLEEVALSEPEAMTITAKDGWEIQGWLLRPYGFQAEKKYPFVLEIHGGPHAMYGQTFFHELQLLAAKGYVVLYTNPRGSHGYGQKFVDACRADYGGKDYTDLMSAVDYVLEKYSFIDKERLGVTGGSYGGFMTNWIVGHTNRFKAAVTQRSISNWLSFYGVSDIGFFFTKWELGHNLLDDPKKLWEFSPLKYAENVETPLLILHGELDFRCPIEQGEQLFITLKHLKKEVEFVRFPGANHELSRSGKPALRIERLQHICRWFETYL